MYALEARRKGIQTTLKPKHEPSCFDCQNCEIVNPGEKGEFWCCETVGWGVPCKCDPPYDEPCKFFSTTERFDNDEFHKITDSIIANMDD